MLDKYIKPNAVNVWLNIKVIKATGKIHVFEKLKEKLQNWQLLLPCLFRI